MERAGEADLSKPLREQLFEESRAEHIAGKFWVLALAKAENLQSHIALLGRIIFQKIRGLDLKVLPVLDFLSPALIWTLYKVECTV